MKGEKIISNEKIIIIKQLFVKAIEYTWTDPKKTLAVVGLCLIGLSFFFILDLINSNYFLVNATYVYPHWAIQFLQGFVFVSILGTFFAIYFRTTKRRSILWY